MQNLKLAPFKNHTNTPADKFVVQGLSALEELAVPLNSVSSTDLLSIPLSTSCKLLTKILCWQKEIWPSKMKPCRIPSQSGNQLDVTPFTIILWAQPFSQLFTPCIMILLCYTLDVLSTLILWETLLKTLLKYKQTATDYWLPLNYWGPKFSVTTEQAI